MNQREIADHLDLSQAAISHFLSKAGLVECGDIDQVRIAYIRHLREMAAGRGSAELETERLALTKAKRIAAEIANRERCGNLVEAEPARRAITTWAAMARNAFETIPDKLSPRLAHETEADKCHALLGSEIEAVLCDLAEGARSLKLSGGNL